MYVHKRQLLGSWRTEDGFNFRLNFFVFPLNIFYFFFQVKGLFDKLLDILQHMFGFKSYK